jgi:hypothetical protein
VPGLTAGKGTMKRKRQIRELIDHHEKDHIDNPFEATPFKRLKTFNVNVRFFFVFVFCFTLDLFGSKLY